MYCIVRASLHLSRIGFLHYEITDWVLLCRFFVLLLSCKHFFERVRKAFRVCKLRVVSAAFDDCKPLFRCGNFIAVFLGQRIIADEIAVSGYEIHRNIIGIGIIAQIMCVNKLHQPDIDIECSFISITLTSKKDQKIWHFPFYSVHQHNRRLLLNCKTNFVISQFTICLPSAEYLMQRQPL